jgi:hypothetical protein
VILLLSLVVGITVGLACGGRWSGLQHLRLRGESVLVALLFTQMLLPWMSASGVAGRTLFWLWAITFPVMAGICMMNARVPGMALASAGLVLNAVVILLNLGMPVLPEAVSVAGGSIAVLNSMDFAHNVVNARTMLPVLADVLPIPGPAGVRGVASAGDIVLACGVAVCLSGAMIRHARVASHPRAGSSLHTEK